MLSACGGIHPMEIMRQVDKLTRLPQMLKPLEMAELKRFFLDLAREMIARLNPER
jgi:hypothetical protein